MSELLTADELARRLKVKTDTVRAWARDNRIPSVRLSHKVIRFDLSAVVEALTNSAKRREVAHVA